MAVVNLGGRGFVIGFVCMSFYCLLTKVADFCSYVRHDGNVSRHIILVANHPPCDIPVMRSGTYCGYTIDKLLEVVSKVNMILFSSILCLI